MAMETGCTSLKQGNPGFAIRVYRFYWRLVLSPAVDTLDTTNALTDLTTEKHGEGWENQGHFTKTLW